MSAVRPGGRALKPAKGARQAGLARRGARAAALPPAEELGAENNVTPSGVVLERPCASAEQLAAVGTLAASRVNDGDRVGLGSGRAALAFVRALGARVIGPERLDVVGVPTSVTTAEVAAAAGVPLATLAEVRDSRLDIAVDGADEVHGATLDLLKGGGGNLVREKILEASTDKLIVVVGEEKVVGALGEQFPVFAEVIEFGLPHVARAVEELGGTCTRRTDADGTPFVTDDGNAYVHCAFGTIADTAALAAALRVIPGVVDTGIFLGMADEAYVAKVDGSIDHLLRPIR